MKSQWMLILGFVFALIIALFAIVNVGSVEFNYLFGKTSAPLILVILISTLFGGLTVGFLGMFKIYTLSKQLKHYKKEWKEKGLAPIPEATSLFTKKAKLDNENKSSANEDATDFASNNNNSSNEN